MNFMRHRLVRIMAIESCIPMGHIWVVFIFHMEYCIILELKVFVMKVVRVMMHEVLIVEIEMKAGKSILLPVFQLMLQLKVYQF